MDIGGQCAAASVAREPCAGKNAEQNETVDDLLYHMCPKVQNVYEQRCADDDRGPEIQHGCPVVEGHIQRNRQAQVKPVKRDRPRVDNRNGNDQKVKSGDPGKWNAAYAGSSWSDALAQNCVGSVHNNLFSICRDRSVLDHFTSAAEEKQ